MNWQVTSCKYKLLSYNFINFRQKLDSLFAKFTQRSRFARSSNAVAVVHKNLVALVIVRDLYSFTDNISFSLNGVRASRSRFVAFLTWHSGWSVDAWELRVVKRAGNKVHKRGRKLLFRFRGEHMLSSCPERWKIFLAHSLFASRVFNRGHF